MYTKLTLITQTIITHLLPKVNFNIFNVWSLHTNATNFIFGSVVLSSPELKSKCRSYTVPRFPLPIFHRFHHLPILPPCFSLFTLSLVFALPSLACLYCPMSALQSLTFHHCPLFGPPFTDLSVLSPVWPSHH